MEKFTKWADKGTHINPFLPPRTASKGSLPTKLALGLASLTLFLVRLPIFVAAVVLLELAVLATSPPFWLALGGAVYAASEQGIGPHQTASEALLAGGVSLVQTASGALLAGGVSLLIFRPLRRLLDVLLVRTAVRFLLAVLGVSYIEQHANLRMLGLRPPGYKVPTTAVGASVQAGDILISNHTSLLDVLYLSSRFLPIFAAFSVGPKVDFQGLSLFGAVWNACGIPRRDLTNGKRLLDLVEQARVEQRAVSVFPELARSNGEAVLAFVNGVFTDLDASTVPVRAHVLGFSSAESGSPMTCHTVGNPIWFLLHLLTKMRTVIKVTYVSAEDAPVLSLKSEGKSSIVASLSKKSTGAWAEDIRSLLAQMVSAKKLKVGLGYEDFVTFNQYWKAVQGGDIKTADRLAGARDKI